MVAAVAKAALIEGESEGEPVAGVVVADLTAMLVPAAPAEPEPVADVPA